MRDEGYDGHRVDLSFPGGPIRGFPDSLPSDMRCLCQLSRIDVSLSVQLTHLSPGLILPIDLPQLDPFHPVPGYVDALDHLGFLLLGHDDRRSGNVASRLG